MTDVLRSWNDSAAKSAIVDFVARVTCGPGGDYVPPAARIATFDNDGTLWCEYPLPAQAYFLIDRAPALAAKDPAISNRQPFKAFLERDAKTLQALGKQEIVELMFATHAGMTDEAFDHIARDWLANARHPKLGRAFTKSIYQPQLELLEYLRANAFKTFIVSGGGIEFIRAFAEETYGFLTSRLSAPAASCASKCGTAARTW